MIDMMRNSMLRISVMGLRTGGQYVAPMRLFTTSMKVGSGKLERQLERARHELKEARKKKANKTEEEILGLKAAVDQLRVELKEAEKEAKKAEKEKEKEKERKRKETEKAKEVKEREKEREREKKKREAEKSKQVRERLKEKEKEKEKKRKEIEKAKQIKEKEKQHALAYPNKATLLDELTNSKGYSHWPFEKLERARAQLVTLLREEPESREAIESALKKVRSRLRKVIAAQHKLPRLSSTPWTFFLSEYMKDNKDIIRTKGVTPEIVDQYKNMPQSEREALLSRFEEAKREQISEVRKYIETMKTIPRNHYRYMPLEAKKIAQEVDKAPRKLPTPAYAHFVKEHGISPESAALWRNLSPSEKEPYEALFEKEKREYEESSQE